MTLGLQNKSLSFEALYEQAADSIADFKDWGSAILASLRSSDEAAFSDVSFDVGPLKQLSRAWAKANADYAGDHSRVTDFVRGRYITKTVNQIDAICTYVENNAEELGIEVLKNQFSKPTDTGFRALNMKLRLPNGHVTELRVEHEGLMMAAKNTHELYEKIQEIERRADSEKRLLTDPEAIERQMLLDQVRDIHYEPVAESGLDSLLSDEGRQKLDQFKRERVVIADGVAKTGDRKMLLAELFADCVYAGHPADAGVVVKSDWSGQDIAGQPVEQPITQISDFLRFNL